MERIKTAHISHAYAIDEAGDTVYVANINSNFIGRGLSKMKSGKLFSVFLCLLFCAGIASAQDAAPKHDVKFRVVAIAEIGNKDHQGFVDAAKIYLSKLAAENNSAIDYIGNTKPINDAFLAKYKLFIQLNYPPYMWTPTAQQAIESYLTEGKGGWIGFHHAALLGD